MVLQVFFQGGMVEEGLSMDSELLHEGDNELGVGPLTGTSEQHAVLQAAPGMLFNPNYYAFPCLRL
ncbi:hypothetical protein [Paenibacillus jilunlii]|uniref:Uncharacterized protein n=1 Tax=Paenibacillus jilunlii TaxID=682956 RepID=A0A1G9HGN4_9BACL|nr:hypothetical protein [Paenibacillus jilunlii]KWX69668.1 hypothetical protein AML91_28110 [Paenibacillus jilunlii]SDL12065.1 hypothetical protein SAMN05216191_101850 [Paenibacillus jilunlii]